MIRIYLAIIGFALITTISIGCGKEYLEKKNNKALLVPTTLIDMRAILDNITQQFCTSPGLNIISGDEFTTSEQGLSALPELEKNVYLWEKNIYVSSALIQDWTVPYKQVFYSNIVLEALEDIKYKNNTEEKQWNTIKGEALFHRAFAFYNLSQTFAAVYQQETANITLGIPIRLTADVNIKSERGSLKNTYDQTITDLKQALLYLQAETQYNSRPGKAAGYALLARVTLSMSDYTNAELYADSALSINKSLLDYNTLDTTGTTRKFPNALPKGNAEILFYSSMPLYRYPLNSTLVLIENTLYKSYHRDDLRRPLYFRDLSKNGNITFRGTYSGESDAALFSGLATDELYLIKAECAARRSDRQTALYWLNDLLLKRYKKDKFIALNPTSNEDVLKAVLMERRKELFSRGLRWGDLRRLNLEPKFAITLRRTLNGNLYELPPGDNRYVFPIPPEEITGNGIPQNER